ncbi:HD domain-containing protein [Geomonas sp. RF6]|uniref:HD domain-containing protein n=1 Tax=Geomonas sp. RF6 TaxID=2897342 RepID=UPI001E5C3609|nr:HD domain-containing protein [Geomonas sp. RF6]UFS70262.1 HD domain-containing protein [Geomonas sp. RF6]
MTLIEKVKGLFPPHLHPRLFMVGGMVRDLLLGVESQDVDLAGAVPHDELIALGFRLVQSKSTPPMYFRFHRELGKIELTPLSDISDLTDDLSRRDFTINAIAESLDGTIVDPLRGRDDLAQMILKTCSPESLTNDPGRIFRAFRFESGGWRLTKEDEETIASRDWSADFGRLPVERFSQEMLKALGRKEPALFFRRLQETGTCTPFLPELARMPHVPAGPVEHHPEGDLLSHSLQVLERAAQSTPDVTARFCAFFHDFGKLATPPELYPKHHGHEAAGAEAAVSLCRRLKLPAALQRALEYVCRSHGNANRWQELRVGTKMRLAVDAVKGGISEILPLVVAADFGEPLDGWHDAVKIAALSTVELGLEPGYFDEAGIAPEKRQEIVLQRRIEAFRNVQKGLADPIPTLPSP